MTEASTGRLRARVVDATADEAAAWDAHAVRSPFGETLQSHTWGEIKRREGWTPLRYRIEDDDGPVAVVALQEKPLAGRVTHRLPGALGRSGRMARAAGTFLYAPVGPVLLRPEPEAARLALAAVRRIGRRRRAALTVIDPAWEEGGPLAQVLERSGFRQAVRQVQVSRTAMLVPLDADEGAQHARVNDRVARNINKARRAGVTTTHVAAADAPEARERGLQAMYDILEATAQRKAFGLRDREFVLASVRALLEAGHASIWFARHEGEDVATTLLHHSGDRVVLFLAGARDAEERRKVPANFLLQWDILRWAAGEGFRHYDLGGVDTPDAPGMPHDATHPLWSLFEFKRQWGARPVLYGGAFEATTVPLRGHAVQQARRLLDASRATRGAG